MSKRVRRSAGCGLAAAALPLLLAWGCGRGEARGEESPETGTRVAASWNPGSLTGVSGVPIEAVRASVRQRLGAARPAALGERQWRHVQGLYRSYGQGPLWFGSQGLDEARVSALLSALLGAQDDALRLEAYPLNELARSLAAVKEANPPTAQQVADADVLLTSAYAALGQDLLTGQVDPKSVSKSWFIDARDENVDSALARTLREEPLDRSMARMRPQDEGYAALQQALRSYRQLAARGGWASVPEGKALKPGQSDRPARLAALRRRLRTEGLLGADSAAQPAAGGVYDARLAGAVAAFQARHGIVADSVLGTETVASLNTPVGYRVGQIAANLERLRWLPRTLGSRYILVNVPAFRLEAYDGGQKALEMKVIVGEEFEDKATPVFSDSMEYVVFRPYWLVTDDIAAKEIFPKMQADPGYLAAHDLETYQENGKTRVRQKPGPENSLGLVKFIFPNDFNIYLHDTPEDHLFEKDVRAFSHGCIRVEKPVDLARFVLGWPPERIRQAMQEGPDDRRVNLPHKVPVYIAYFTAYQRDGQLYFGNDLYRRDDALIHEVGPGALPGPQTRQALEQLRRYVVSGTGAE